MLYNRVIKVIGMKPLSMLLLVSVALFPMKCDKKKPAVVFIRPKPSSVDTADSTLKLCAFVVMPDSEIRVGIDPRDPDSVATRVYCSGKPLTDFKAEFTK